MSLPFCHEAKTAAYSYSSHGTFRPSLKKLVSQNEENAVREVTDSVFAAWSEPEKNIKVSINTLSKLRGIGPATASLLLSIHDPEAVPFFSDELFRWLHWEDKPTKGWDRKIGYTIKEYLELFSKVDELRKRIQEESGRDVSATDAEKVAYVLGHQANQQSAGKEYEDAVKGMFEPESAGGDGNVKTTTAPEEPREEIEKARGKSAAKSGRKRRAGREAQSTSVEAPRRSKRTR